MKQNGKSLPVNISYSYTNNEFYFYVDSIERQAKEGKVVVEWNAESIHAIQKGEQKIALDYNKKSNLKQQGIGAL